MTKLMQSNNGAKSISITISNGLLNFKLSGPNGAVAYTSLDVQSMKFAGVQKKSSIFAIILNFFIRRSVAANSGYRASEEKKHYVVGVSFSDGVKIAFEESSGAIVKALREWIATNKAMNA